MKFGIRLSLATLLASSAGLACAQAVLTVASFKALADAEKAIERRVRR